MVIKSGQCRAPDPGSFVMTTHLFPEILNDLPHRKAGASLLLTTAKCIKRKTFGELSIVLSVRSCYM